MACSDAPGPLPFHRKLTKKCIAHPNTPTSTQRLPNSRRGSWRSLRRVRQSASWAYVQERCAPFRCSVLRKRHVNPLIWSGDIGSEVWTCEPFLHRRPASTSRMACSMASHACLARAQPLPLLRRVALLPSSTPIAQTGAISRLDSLSPHHINGLLELCIQANK